MARYIRFSESRHPLGAIPVNNRHRHTRRMGVLQNFLHLQLQLRDRLRRLRWRILVIGRSTGSQKRKKNGSTPQFLHDRPLPSRGQEGRTAPVGLIYTPKLLVRTKFARHPPFGTRLFLSRLNPTPTLDTARASRRASRRSRPAPGSSET